MKKHGFSLIELSIVLVILGLLVGGILAGRSLIHAAELRSISADMTQYKTAVAAFKDKYFGLPGDIANAQNFWGPSSGSACTGGVGTCNGNGDGQWWVGSDGLHAWEQMQLAGLLPGSLDGKNNSWVIDQTIPRARIADSGYRFLYVGGGSNGVFTAVYGLTGNILSFSASDGTAYPLANLIAEDAWNIDQKMDDGIATTGTMLTVDGPAAGQCIGGGSGSGFAGAGPFTGSYVLGSAVKACILWYRIGL